MKYLFAIALCLIIFGAIVIAATPIKKDICPICKKPIVVGDTIAPVQGKNGSIYYVHFTCALNKHLRTFDKKERK